MWKNGIIKGEYCMKNWKQNALIGMVAIVALGFAFAACGGGDGDDDPVEFREATINLFGEEKITSNQNPNRVGEPYTAKVQSTLTQTQWNGVANKIETAINGSYTASEIWDQAKFKTVFSGTIKIIVEVNTMGYKKWKTSTDGETMYLAFDALDNNLKGSVFGAIQKMAVPEEGND
jgi:hypothetical protein